MLATWWKGFNDARLDGLVERAILHNHDLRIATANLKEARALRRLTTFDLAPTVQGNAGYQNSLLSKCCRVCRALHWLQVLSTPPIVE